MSSAPVVDRSTLRLSEVARHVVIPEGIVDTLWFEIEERCREFGVEFDVWQDGLGQVMFGLREDGTFAATVGGVAMSIPRQVAKTFIVSRAVIALCSLYPDLTVLWTAHRLRTATNTFQKMKAFATRRQVLPYLEPGRNMGTAIRDANGEQEIPFANGSRILFGAREQGFGRGFDEVDVEVFDEAQILKLQALEDMVAATNQSRFEHGALLFYMGTPPRPVDAGEAFASRREGALEVKGDAPDFGDPVAAGDALYVECSADPSVGMKGGPDLYDLGQVETANPSYPHRTPPVSVERLRKNLPDDDAWRREGLGVWDSASVGKPFPLWPEAATGFSPDEDVKASAIGVDMSHARVIAVSGCWVDPDVPDDSHIELLSVDADGDTAAAVDWIAEQAGRRMPVVIDTRSPAASMIPTLKARKVRVVAVGPGDSAKACGGLFDALRAGHVWHTQATEDNGQQALDDAMATATKRNVGTAGAWELDVSDPEIDVSAAKSAVLAHLGASMTKKKRAERRKVVVRS